MKTSITKWIALIPALFLSTWVSASAGDSKETWSKSCAKCHGADGNGQTTMGKKLKVKDYTDAKIQGAMTDAEAFKAIKEGVKNDDKVLMKAAEGLSDADIKALVQLIRGFKK